MFKNYKFSISSIVYLSSFVLIMTIASMFFSSMNIEGYTKVNEVEYHEIDHPWDAGSIYHFFNSDALWMVSLSDGIVNEHCLKGWNMGTCPNVFPGLFIIMFITIFIKNIVLIQLVNAFVQFFLFIILINYLYKEINPKISLYSLSFANLILSLFLIWPLYYRDVIISLNLFLPFHIGAFLSALLALILLFKYYKSLKTKFLIWYIILLILSSFSNSIFIVFFGAPIVITLLLLLLSNRKKQISILLIATVLSILLGWLIYRALILTNIIYITELPSFPDNIMQSFNVAISQIKSLIMEGSIFRRIVFSASIISIIAFVVLAIYIAVKHFRNWFKNGLKPEISNMEFFVIFFSIMIIGSIAAPIIKGIFFSSSEIRYYVFGLFLGLTNIAFLLDFYATKKPKLIAAISIGATVILLGFVCINYTKYKPLNVASIINSYYPGIVKAVDDLSIKYPLKNGTGFHWDAKHVTYLSRCGNKVNSTYSGLYLRHFGNNLSTFFYNDCNKKDTAFFNYIVLRTIGDTTQVCNFFGDKIVRVSQNGYKFYLVPDFYYDRNTHLPVITNRNIFIISE